MRLIEGQDLDTSCAAARWIQSRAVTIIEQIAPALTRHTAGSYIAT